MKKKITPEKLDQSNPIRTALKITLIYGVFGVLWIAFSDLILLTITGSQEAFYRVSLYKGWMYVFLTAILLYYLTRKSLLESYALSIDLLENYMALKKTQDILSEKIDTITHLAYYDSVTGLPNKLHFKTFTDRIIKEDQESFAMIYMDIDHFKMVNDTVGHTLGDELLKQFANRLKNVSTRIKCFARIGGDEFAFLIPTSRKEDPLIAHILSKIKEPLSTGNRDFYLSGSIGVSLYPVDGEDFDTLFKKSDTAMYAAKNNGRDCIRYFHESLEEEVLEYVELQSNMQTALMDNHFVMYYQPLFHLKTGRLIGAESLIRWQHPTKGMIAPDRFIPIAEKTGFIKSLGSWIINSVFSQVKLWEMNAPKGFACSINLSTIQLNEIHFLETVSDLAEKHHINPSTIVFEITENIAIEDNQLAIEKLKTLRDWGFKIALDDFGTGYSSLSYLHRLPLDYLKMDRSFVSTIDHNKKIQSISEAVIYLSHKLKLKVVAEGIETAKHEGILKSMNCDFAQGYLFSKPIDRESFERKYFGGKGGFL